MIQTHPFRTHAKQYDEWFDKHPFVYESELIAIKQQLLSLGENIYGIEVGVGTGRFASRLGIKEGIEPVEAMAAIARNRGVEIMKSRAEKLPYKDLHFDFILLVTICHLDNLPSALKEIHRVLKNKGSVIIGFLDKDGQIAQSYEEKRKTSRFYRNATFYPVKRVDTLLKAAGFKNLEYSQTLFGKLEDITEYQSAKSGHGRGSFVVVKAKK